MDTVDDSLYYSEFFMLCMSADEHYMHQCIL